MSATLTTRIPIKDRNGRVVDEKEVATFAGLLARAHEEGLHRIDTHLVQSPSEENGHLAIVHAIVETEKGTFTGIGDASPANVNRRIAPHIIRMAETRAKARALRDAVNIGLVAMEELGEDLVVDEQPEPSNVRSFRPRRSRNQGRDQSRDDCMSDAQRRLLFRILSRAGFQGDDISDKLCHDAQVNDVRDITKRQASSLIDAYKEVAGA